MDSRDRQPPSEPDTERPKAARLEARESPLTDERSAWDRIAPRYERVIPWFDGRYDAVRERLRRDLDGRRRVLELGAGTGQFTGVLAAVAEQLTATDLSPEMLSRLAQRLEAEGVTGNVELRTMDASSIRAEDQSFDAVVCANLLHIVERPKDVLDELRRVLRQDGLLIAPTFCYGESLLARLALVPLGMISPFRVHGRFSAASLASLVASAGFSVEASENLGGWLPEVYLRARSSHSGRAA